MQVAFGEKWFDIFGTFGNQRVRENIVTGPVGHLYVMDNWVKTVSCDSGC